MPWKVFVSWVSDHCVLGQKTARWLMFCGRRCGLCHPLTDLRRQNTDESSTSALSCVHTPTFFLKCLILCKDIVQWNKYTCVQAQIVWPLHLLTQSSPHCLMHTFFYFTCLLPISLPQSTFHASSLDFHPKESVCGEIIYSGFWKI